MREPGFYWIVEFKGDAPQVARWSGHSWYATGYDLDIPDPVWISSERLIPPDEASSAAHR